MRIPRHWTKASYTGRDLEGEELTCTAWGWSFDGLAGAKDDARARARRVFDCLINGRQPSSYEYSDRPLREEIVDSMRQGDKDLAVITRNRYGALVLNTASVLFVDIDFTRIKPYGLWDAILLVLLGSRRRSRRSNIRKRTLEAVRDWSQRNPNHSFRVYRTFAGLRLLFVDGLYDPSSEQVSRILDELDSDPLYRTLTNKQECFRARLTPKPWRCDADVPPNQYPWPDERAERLYRDWEDRYAQAIESYKVCELVETYGSPASNTEIEAVQQTHDQLACLDQEKPLA